MPVHDSPFFTPATFAPVCNNQTTTKTNWLHQGCMNLVGIDKRIVLKPERLGYGLNETRGIMFKVLLTG